MAKEIDTYIKLQVPAGQASPSPPVGPAFRTTWTKSHGFL